MKNKNGITLVALVITIVVLIILAAVTLNLTLGENGLFRTATGAVEEHTKAQLKEELELAIVDIQTSKFAEGKTIQIGDLSKLNNGTFQVEDTSAFPVIVTTEKYEYEIDNNFKVTYSGPVSGLRVTYLLSTTDWTKEDIIITINATSTDSTIASISTPTGLTKDDDGYKASENGTYIFEVKDSANNEKEISVTINNIDKTAPEDFTPTISNVTTSGFTITANAQDISGIVSYEYYIGENGPYTSTSGVYVATELTSGAKYDVYVIATNGVGLSKTSNTVQGCPLKEYTLYKDNSNKIAYIPNGFTVSQVSGETQIDEGLVILDGDGNEFVWIPVDDYDAFITDTEYKSALYSDNIQEEKYQNMIASVRSYGGFYIGRYEIGQDNVISKQNQKVNYYINLTSGNTICTQYAGSRTDITVSLMYGVQWDAVLRFIHSKLPSYNLTDSSSWGNYKGVSKTYTGLFCQSSGSNTWVNTTNATDTYGLIGTGLVETFKTLNIYDFAGNISEITLEGSGISRGGNYSNDAGAAGAVLRREVYSAGSRISFFL